MRPMRVRAMAAALLALTVAAPGVASAEIRLRGKYLPAGLVLGTSLRSGEPASLGRRPARRERDDRGGRAPGVHAASRDVPRADQDCGGNVLDEREDVVLDQSMELPLRAVRARPAGAP